MAISLQDKRILLVHLASSLPVARQALGRLEPTYFDLKMELPYYVIWEAASNWTRENHSCAPYPHLEAAVVRVWGSLPSDMRTAEAATELQDLLATIRDFPGEALLPDVVIPTTLQRLLNERGVEPLLRESVNGVRPIPEVLSAINQQFARHSVSTAESTDPFGDRRFDDVVACAREPLNSPIFDLLTEGGPRRQQLIGLLGFSGGGKTTLALQTAVDTARTGRHVNFFTYERPVITELRDCMYSYAAQIDRNQLEGIPLHQWSAENQRRVEVVRGQIGGFMHCWDMLPARGAGLGGLPEVENCLQQEQTLGRPPFLVVIDWVYAMAQAYQAAQATNAAKGKRPIEIYDLLMQIASQLKKLAVEFNCIVVAVTQFAGEAATRGTKRTTQYDALGCKGSTMWMDLTINIGPKGEPDEPITIRSTKGRSVGCRQVDVILDGRFNCMRICDEECVTNISRDGERHRIRRSATEGTSAAVRPDTPPAPPDHF